MSLPFQLDENHVRSTVREIFRWANAQFRAGQSHTVEAVLRELDESQYSETILVGFLMACQPIRSTPSFQGFGERVRRHLGPIIGHRVADREICELYLPLSLQC